MGKRLQEFAFVDLKLKGYSHGVMDEMVETENVQQSRLGRMRYFLEDGWEILDVTFPDPERTDTERFPMMSVERRALSYGTVWLEKVF